MASSLSDLGMSSVYNYVAFTVIFFLAKFFYFPEDNLVWILVFFVMSFFLEMINNMYLTSRSELCGRMQTKMAFFSTFPAWIFVFGLTILCIVFFPGWLRVFSNTVGLAAARAYGLNELLTKIFTSEQKKGVTIDRVGGGGGLSDESIQVLKTVDSIYNDPSVLINELDSSDFIDFTVDNPVDFEAKKKEWSVTYEKEPQNISPESPAHIYNWTAINKLIPLFLKQVPNQENLKELHGMVQLKENVGYFIWFILIGTVSVLISTNTLLATSCGNNPGSMYDVIFNTSTATTATVTPTTSATSTSSATT
jgi:hypothetical protein